MRDRRELEDIRNLEVRKEVFKILEIFEEGFLNSQLELVICHPVNPVDICDDIDYNFKGNQDEYSTCNHCHTSFLFYIRYGHVWKYDKTKMYFDENDKCWYCSDNPKDTETVIVYKKG